MKRSCQRQTQVFDLPVRRMISLVPTPSALSRNPPPGFKCQTLFIGVSVRGISDANFTKSLLNRCFAANSTRSSRPIATTSRSMKISAISMILLCQFSDLAARRAIVDEACAYVAASHATQIGSDRSRKSSMERRP